MKADLWQPDRPDDLGRLFQRVGRTGFWIQIVLLGVTLAVGAWVLAVRPAAPEGAPGVGLRNLLSLASLGALVFTTFWFRRYIATGARIREPAQRPQLAKVKGMLWTGLWAGGAGAFLSLALLLGAVGRLLYLLLVNPQIGVLIAPGPAYQSVSAIDALSMMALILMLGAELVVLALTLWLLFRCTRTTRAAVPGV